jgi:hypothetical protein
MSSLVRKPDLLRCLNTSTVRSVPAEHCAICASAQEAAGEGEAEVLFPRAQYANSVVSNRQARAATKAYLKGKFGLPLSEPEAKAVAHTLGQPEAVAGLSSP